MGKSDSGQRQVVGYKEKRLKCGKQVNNMRYFNFLSGDVEDSVLQKCYDVQPSTQRCPGRPVLKIVTGLEPVCYSGTLLSGVIFDVGTTCS